MAGHDIICIGASAGGIEALRTLTGGLPPGIPAALFVVVHLAAGGTSVLPDILNRSGELPAVHPFNGEPIRPGTIYVAPPDHHLLIHGKQIRLGRGPRENRCRPAVDPLFRTAARHYDGRTVGVVLSGNLDDGMAGLIAIKSRGGIAIAQDPKEALYPGMPAAAVANAQVDYVLPVADIAQTLLALAHQPVAAGRLHGPPAEQIRIESDIAELQMASNNENGGPLGEPSGFACPDCGGALFELQDGRLIRYRCRVGHAFSPESLLAGQSEAVESSFWSALRALEESAEMSRQLAERGHRRGDSAMAARFARRASEAAAHADVLRTVLTSRNHAAAVEPVEETDAGHTNAGRSPSQHP